MSTVREFKALARDRGLKGYSKMKKSELIDLLNGKLVITKTTVKNLKDLAKNRGLKDIQN